MTKSKNKILTGTWLAFMILLDGILTDIALNSMTGFYELNTFTNTFGIFAHTILLLGVTYLLVERWIKKDCLTSKALITLGVLVWTINNAISIYLLYLR